MGSRLIFPVLTLCNKNNFNVSRIKELKLAKAVEEDAIELSNNRSRHFQQRCYNVSRLPPDCWDISDLIGYRGMDVKQVWDAVAHNPEKMIIEVIGIFRLIFQAISYIMTWHKI